ncbi:alpha/beta-hydrolase [Aspergillus steynii IBT 23096]|uniref:Alpha/beta-hydrolase n=1 Tax=Aspergillus steynii IBT 23096 TaxID=1392250 RepID=A0A2I2GAR2_9EURO|nr:alpha/beta-hydrolase [Aspergillus steynii IBT 23096]PLB49974.1 alpha/beta-hydrolase [Aspergillus steynii IBT 23096]
MIKLFYQLFLVASVVGAVQTNCTSNARPIVDLGNEIYQATEPENDTTDYYSFSNIRYAAAPVGDLRWAAPVAPRSNRTAIQSKSQPVTCGQGSSAWQIVTSTKINKYLETGVTPNVSYSELPTFLSDGVEDCLFLDVVTPRTIFAHMSEQQEGQPGSLAPVLNGLVYVALNYRLGAFGFLSGPSFEQQGAFLNAGLHDQSGTLPPLFRRAIAQSPAYFPYRSAADCEDAFRSFLGRANASTLAEARRLPSAALLQANADTTGQAQPYHFPIYGPTPDNSLVVADPKVHRRRGEFDRSVTLAVSHNSDEGLVLVPAIHTDDEYIDFLQSILTRAPASTIAFVADTRTAADMIIDCNAGALRQAYANSSFGYYFDLTPGIHAQDVPYTFYTPGQPASGYSLVDTGLVNETVAFAWQDYIVGFAKTGVPRNAVDDLSKIPRYGIEGMVVGFGNSEIRTLQDPAVNERCEWWGLGLF